MTPNLKVVSNDEPKPKRVKPPKSYRDYMKAKGIRLVRFEPTTKLPGTYEIIHGELVKVRER